MAYRCYICNKGNWHGKRSRHHKGVAGGAWKHKAQSTPRLWKANLHKLRVVLDGDQIKRVKLCTDCISILKQKKQMHVHGQSIKRVPYGPEATQATT